MCADLYTFKTNFEPILLPGETAHLITANTYLDVECVDVGALPEYYKDFGALTAATWDADNEDTNLEMNDWELGQFRVRIVDDIKMRFNNPGSVRQWRTKSGEFYLRQFPTVPEEQFLQEYLFKASEFFVYEDDTTPRFDFYSDVATLTSRVLFSGWRIKVKKTAVPGRTTIWVSGWPSGQPAR